MSRERRPDSVTPPSTDPGGAPERRRLRLHVAIGLLSVLFLLPALGVQYWIYQREHQESLETELRRTQTRGRTIAALVEQEFEATVRTMRSIAGRPSVRAAWERRDLASLDPHLTEARALAPELLFAGAFDLDGTVRRGVPPDRTVVGGNFAHRDWHRGVTATGRPYVSEVFRLQVRPQRLVVGVAVPLVGASERPQGILMAAVSLERLQQRIEETQRGIVGEPIVVDQRGRIVVARGFVQGTDPVLASDPDLVAKGLAGREAVHPVGHGTDGYVASVTPVPSLGWAVLYRRSNATALAVLYRTRRRMLNANLYLALVFLLTAGVAVHLVRQQHGLDRAVRRHSEELQTLLDSMSTMVATVAPDGRLLQVNRTAQVASGLTPSELMDTHFLHGPWWAFDPEVQERVTRAFARACAGEPVSYEERILVFGQVTDISFSLNPVGGADGRVAYLVAEGRDVTPLKTAEAILQQRSRDLEALNHELEAFTYSVSHDLRAPLRAVAGFARILEEDHAGRLDPAGLGYLRRIVEGARQMGVLIDDLLNLSRLGRTPLARQPTDLSEVVQDVRRKLAQEAGERRIEWCIQALPPVDCDERLIRQVFVNLLSNAMKYTRPRECARITVGAETLDGQALIFIRDNGVGFDMKYAHKLFGVFQRLHDATSFEGTGVGLATVQRIVSRHGGRIWAEAAVDEGATFFFTLGAAATDLRPLAAGERGGEP